MKTVTQTYKGQTFTYKKPTQAEIDVNVKKFVNGAKKILEKQSKSK